LREFDHGRVWKRIVFAVMERLCGGHITEPRGQHESVYLTDEGLALALEHAKKH
jgi:hypothetical protein